MRISWPAPLAPSIVPSSVTIVADVLSKVITVAVTDRTRAQPLFSALKNESPTPSAPMKINSPGRMPSSVMSFATDTIVGRLPDTSIVTSPTANSKPTTTSLPSAAGVASSVRFSATTRANAPDVATAVLRPLLPELVKPLAHTRSPVAKAVPVVTVYVSAAVAMSVITDAAVWLLKRSALVS